ncbi:hypothetical protein SOPP22_17170 [Shewanella sp. OPT22]|nr:hypothetical protein SOPP22_17170 [Shewanella sp. OPT22]
MSISITSSNVSSNVQSDIKPMDAQDKKQFMKQLSLASTLLQNSQKNLVYKKLLEKLEKAYKRLSSAMKSDAPDAEINKIKKEISCIRKEMDCFKNEKHSKINSKKIQPLSQEALFKLANQSNNKLENAFNV